MSHHGLEHPAILCTLGVIQLLGLTSAFATRVRRLSRDTRICQGVFFACLGVVALSTIWMVGEKSGAWLPSGTTFSLMVLTAVCDFGRDRKAARW